MPLAELSRWRMYFELQPFGFLRDEYLTAQICSTIREMSGKSYKPGKHPPINELMHYTVSMQDVAKPGQRLKQKIKNAFAMLRQHGNQTR